MQLWQAETISYETLFTNLQQGEIIPHGTTHEEEREKIKSGLDDLGVGGLGDQLPPGGGGQPPDDDDDDPNDDPDA